ncbi:MAG: hypothetical protein LJF15_01740 [Acidobacteria bacterium]|nr:hypothetical protein [Acidobacteriota bacterium]
MWDLTLGALLLPLAVTLDRGQMPVPAILAVPVVAVTLRWLITRPRVGPDGFRRQLAALKLGPMGLLCLLVVVGAVVIGAMARDGREAFEPARSAAPGIAAAAILALAVLAGLLGARLRSARFVAWAGLAVVGLLLEPIAGPGPRVWALGILGVVILGFGLLRLWRFVRATPTTGGGGTRS